MIATLSLTVLALLGINQTLSNYITEETFNSPSYSIDPSFEAGVSAFLIQKEIRRKLNPNDEILSQRVVSINIHFKTIKTTDINPSNKPSCNKHDGKVSFSWKIDKSQYDTLPLDQKDLLVEKALIECLKSDIIKKEMVAEFI